MKDTTAKLLIAAGAVAALAFIVKKNGGVQGVAAGVVKALFGAAGDAASGVVLGIGDAIGVPRTDMTACEQAIAEGRTWDASFACPAGTFLGSILSDRQPDVYGNATPLSEWMGTIASRPITPWVTLENAGGAAFVYPRIRRAS
ncbi:hypothetical protein CF70_012985 [Cupriavidus sp. SK-3]|uniref:hypothetical protein n=1 Tax=Cupriavidus sp. SK-3 TaxID=1470558 RepID=UPI000445D2BF|nr:hypothetical protein [Cupriavidus sp. SK-3]KDP85607.1 hypothetical protein CF70_012985 [Cupriavidus sp. SK-3]